MVRDKYCYTDDLREITRIAEVCVRRMATRAPIHSREICMRLGRELKWIISVTEASAS